MKRAAGGKTWATRLFRFGLPLLILIAGMLGARALIASRPPVPRVDREAVPTLVEVIAVHAQDEQAVLQAYGTVRSHRELALFPRVEGYVIAQHNDLIDGGLVRAGEVLLKIDPQDYRLAVDTERGNLARAEFELQVEQGNQVVAHQEWDLLEPSIETSEMGRLLALRQPHLKEKRAAVDAAKSRLAQAELDLSRTVVPAPCNALVLKETVEIGQLVNARSAVATLVCTDAFRVEVSVPLNQLGWVEFPDAAQSLPPDGLSDVEVRGSAVRILRDLGNGESVQWTGWVERLIGDVTENGRMARVLVLVPDPLGLVLVPDPLGLKPFDRAQDRPGEGHRSSLLLGEYVRVEILGPTLPQTIVLPRSSLREEERVWVYNAQGELEIRQVEVALRRRDSVLIQTGLADGDRVVTSSLPAALPGMRLQAVEAEPASPRADEE